MSIERFIWTEHALDRCRRRWIDRADMERAVYRGHDERKHNDGEADWLVQGLAADGRRFALVYDHPVGHDHSAALIVSVWILRQES
ncbi:MAG TPA: DUF4258 domain-containing protein [Solirubrobacteraceae bacterium]|jgi:hypothetical protein|nr:DUF4258 domain-containing protein [Solirubrobacteraceae bacterium]